MVKKKYEKFFPGRLASFPRLVSTLCCTNVIVARVYRHDISSRGKSLHCEVSIRVVILAVRVHSSLVSAIGGFAP